MRILLDTQAFIWLVNDDQRLGVKSKQLVLDIHNQVYISFLSFFEMTIKASLGKLSFDPSIMQDLEKIGIELILGDYQSLSAYEVFNDKNKDPFDNFLIATAKAKRIAFLTSDHKILGAKISGLRVIDASK